MLTIPAVTRVDALEALIAALAPFAAPTVALYQTNITPSPLLVLADMTAIICDFDGYATSAAITWGTVTLDASYNAYVLGGLIPFICTSAAKPQDAYGYYLTSGGLLVGLEPFDAPQPARKNLDQIDVIPRLAFGQ